jgi:hypothetical protein
MVVSRCESVASEPNRGTRVYDQAVIGASIGNVRRVAAEMPRTPKT